MKSNSPAACVVLDQALPDVFPCVSGQASYARLSDGLEKQWSGTAYRNYPKGRLALTASAELRHQKHRARELRNSFAAWSRACIRLWRGIAEIRILKENGLAAITITVDGSIAGDNGDSACSDRVIRTGGPVPLNLHDVSDIVECGRKLLRRPSAKCLIDAGSFTTADVSAIDLLFRMRQTGARLS
jgi:hypothetical protein